MKFRVGDEVLVTSGKDKGKHGKIERVFPGSTLVMVGGINLFKKHVKNTSDRTKTGGIIEIGKPLPTAKIAYVCKKCTLPTRIGFKMVGSKKVRFCRKCGQEL
jgi:large subunit ribosomal protein L24